MQPDLSDLDDTKKRVHVKPDGDKWIVIELTDLGSYYDDVERYGERVAIANLFHTRYSRGLSTYRSLDTDEKS